ncbi:hypothetical protein L3X38_038515 [Prunus dulcis]|uniref:Uncharacterized protein n=1 Tax=Prunus dulcis TaxID=3755 RepID=A0AAD4V707_PRUDU|nr:hypothetical protein L3X38_038515 [Prunus dulcis]
MTENWRKETRANDVVVLEHEIDRGPKRWWKRKSGKVNNHRRVGIARGNDGRGTTKGDTGRGRVRGDNGRGRTRKGTIAPWELLLMIVSVD